MFEASIATEYNKFLFSCGVEKCDLSGKDMDAIKKSYAAAQKNHDLDGLFRNLREAVRRSLLIRCSPEAAEESEALFVFLIKETPVVTNLLLSHHTKQGLGKACALVDDLNRLNVFSPDVGGICAAAHISCVREAAEQKEFYTGLWHGKWASSISKEIIRADGQGENKLTWELQENAAEALFGLAQKAEESGKSRIAKKALYIASSCTKVDSPLYYRVQRAKTGNWPVPDRKPSRPIEKPTVRDTTPSDR